MEPIIQMVVSALTPMGKEFAEKTGLDAGEHVRDLVADSENTLDDTAVEVLEVFLNSFIQGLGDPAE